jgi:WD repeat-containing protein 48
VLSCLQLIALRSFIVNIAKWLLRNLFLGFVREQQRILSPRRSKDSGSPQEHTSPHRGVHRGIPPNHIDINSSPGRRRSSSDTSRSYSPSTMVVSSPFMVPAVLPLTAGTTGASPLLAPMILLHGASKDLTLSPIPQSPQIHPVSGEMTPMPSKLHHTPAPGTPREGSDYFSHRLRSGSISVATPGDDLKTPSQDTIPGGPGSGLMGRLRNLGKSSSRRVPSDILGSSTSTATGSESTKESNVEVSSVNDNARRTLTPPRSTISRRIPPRHLCSCYRQIFQYPRPLKPLS